MNAKADHVRAATDTAGGAHHCHWPGCTKHVKPAVWGCSQHWFKLPADLRSKVWRSYRPGQEDDKRPSRAYLDVAREVQAWIAANHPPEPSQGSLL